MRSVLVFEDADGTEGVITEDLEVTYSGEWVDEVEACVESVAAEFRDDHGEFEVDAVATELLLELPSVAPIVEVRRSDDE